jgi:phage tail sheath gpL-like
MPLSIPITGVGADYRVPGPFVELLFGQGPASASVGAREVVLVMPKISSGTWTAATLYPITNEADAETGAGAGSPLHRAARKFLQINKDAKLWGLPVSETSSAGGGTAATWTCLFATTPTARGTATVTICGEECSYGYSTSDTVTTIAAGIKASINAKPWLPVTADNSAGTLTVTAKLLGASQGTASIGVISARATVTTGTALTATASAAFLGFSTGVAGVDGTTTEAANTATALAALDSVRKYYIVSSAYDATTLGHLKTHIVNKSEPRRGLRSVGIASYTGTEANGSTIATGRNYERLQIVWFENPDNDCAEIAATVAAIRQKIEGVDASGPIEGSQVPGTRLGDHLNNAYTTSDWPTDTELNDALNDGLAPIKSTDSGPVLVMSVSTRSRNAAGTQDDFRAADTHRVSAGDLFADEVVADWNLNYAGMKFENDEFLADGLPNPNKTLRPNVLRPSIYKAHFYQLLQDFFDRAHLQEITATKASVRVVKTGQRMEVGSNLHVIDHSKQSSFRLAEVSTG